MPIRNLPGVIVNTLDGGLTAAFAPQDDSILIIGTAGQGVVNTPYQVKDRALVAKEFGFSGSLARGIEECASNSDNILAFRCGTKPMVLAGVGLDTTVSSTAAGFSITFNDVTSDAGTRYQHPGPERVGAGSPACAGSLCCGGTKAPGLAATEVAGSNPLSPDHSFSHNQRDLRDFLRFVFFLCFRYIRYN